MTPWRRQLRDLFGSPGLISRGAQQCSNVIWSPRAGTVLLFGLGKPEAPEGGWRKDTEPRLWSQADQLCHQLSGPAPDTSHLSFCEMGSLSHRLFKITRVDSSNILHTGGRVQLTRSMTSIKGEKRFENLCRSSPREDWVPYLLLPGVMRPLQGGYPVCQCA